MARESKRDPLHRDDVPGELDNASSEVDEFEAAIVRGGGGTSEDAVGDDELERQATVSGVPATTSRRESAPAAGRGPGRLVGFVKASWAELKRVQWPDRRQVGQATVVVIGFVIIAGLYLFGADAAAKAVVDAIL